VTTRGNPDRHESERKRGLELVDRKSVLLYRGD